MHFPSFPSHKNLARASNISFQNFCVFICEHMCLCVCLIGVNSLGGGSPQPQI